MKNAPQKKSVVSQKSAAKGSGKQFFTAPEKKITESQTAPAARMRLGGIPLEHKAGFDLISYRLRQLLVGNAQAWEEIDREESGSFWSIFRKYHLPLLLPSFVFFTLRELLHFVNLSLFLRHCLIMLPLGVALYAGYIFILGVIAEETAEHSGGRFSPQSGMRIALFSTLIVSCFSVLLFLPIVGTPLLLVAVGWHYRQLFAGARQILNISDNNYRMYRLSHVLVWLLIGLTAFVAVSLISFLASKLGIAAI
jgi:hypothetical protein